METMAGASVVGDDSDAAIDFAAEVEGEGGDEFVEGTDRLRMYGECWAGFSLGSVSASAFSKLPRQRRRS